MVNGIPGIKNNIDKGLEAGKLGKLAINCDKPLEKRDLGASAEDPRKEAGAICTLRSLEYIQTLVQESATHLK